MKKKREFVENEHYASILETIDVITEFQEAAMNEMQTIEWKKAIQNPEFMALRKRRAIKIAFFILRKGKL